MKRQIDMLEPSFWLWFSFANWIFMTKISAFIKVSHQFIMWNMNNLHEQTKIKQKLIKCCICIHYIWFQGETAWDGSVSLFLFLFLSFLIPLFFFFSSFQLAIKTTNIFHHWCWNSNREKKINQIDNDIKRKFKKHSVRQAVHSVFHLQWYSPLKFCYSDYRQKMPDKIVVCRTYFPVWKQVSSQIKPLQVCNSIKIILRNFFFFLRAC